MAKKQITHDQKLQAFALYTLASNHYAKAREFEAAASEIFGSDPGDYHDAISDGIYGATAGKPLPFDQVLKYAGVTVAPKRRKSSLERAKAALSFPTRCGLPCSSGLAARRVSIA